MFSASLNAKEFMNKIVVQPYLFFNGRCEEALEFYGAAVGAKVEFLMRFKDAPPQSQGPKPPPGWDNKVMHTTFHIGEGVLMASDGCETEPSFKGFSMSLSLPTEAEARRAFDALAAGGQAVMPPAKTFWSPCFGMLTDKFGLAWMVSVPGGPP